MSTEAFKDKPKFVPEPSQGDYWGGHVVNYSTFKFLTLFLGLIGLDHLVLRSPFTAFLKFLININFYGAWWIYDIIQVWTDGEFVSKYGLSTPWGPRGHGFRYFKGVTDTKTNEFPNPSPILNNASTFLYVLYAIFSVILGFLGIPSLIAGDKVGFVFKLISLCLIFPFPIYLMTGVYDYFTSAGVEKEGVPRQWPIITTLTSFLLHDPSESYPATWMLSESEKEKQLAVYTKRVEDYSTKQSTKKPFTTLWEAIYGWATGPLKVFELAGAATKTAEAGAAVTQTTARAMSKIIEKNPEALLPGAHFTPPADTPDLPKQAGGFFAFKSPEESMSTGLDVLVFGGMAVLVLGGLATAFVRKIPFPKRKTEDEYPRKTYGRDDAPPNPGGV